MPSLEVFPLQGKLYYVISEHGVKFLVILDGKYHFLQKSRSKFLIYMISWLFLWILNFLPTMVDWDIYCLITEYLLSFG